LREFDLGKLDYYFIVESAGPVLEKLLQSNVAGYETYYNFVKELSTRFVDMDVLGMDPEIIDLKELERTIINPLKEKYVRLGADPSILYEIARSVLSNVKSRDSVHKLLRIKRLLMFLYRNESLAKDRPDVDEECLRYLYETLKNKLPYKVFWDDYIASIFQRHCRYSKRLYEKVGKHRVIGFIIKDVLSLCAVLDNGEFICNWSYEYACTETRYEKIPKDIYITFRRAIRDQLEEFKSKHARGGFVEINGKLYPRDKVDVHHDVISLEDLIKIFLESKKLKVEDLEKLTNSKIKALLAEWREFHRRNARLVLLPRDMHGKIHANKTDQYIQPF
jgi:hypothetical protein